MTESVGTSDLSVLTRAYDFYDFGCSTGANIARVNEALPGLRGLGIDISAAKVAVAQENGHEAAVFSILDLPDEKCVDFVTMAHFLEHLPGLELAKKMIAKAVSVSRDFVLIRQPWFDADGELARRGFKFYWSHWRGHPNKMTTLDFHSTLQEELQAGRIRRFSIYGRHLVRNSRHPAIIPLRAPRNQRRYDADQHGPKDFEEFPFMAYKEIVVRIDIGAGDRADVMQAQIAPLELLLEQAEA